MSRILIAYYSHSANTKKLAEYIRSKTGGTIFQIQPEQAYPASYNKVVEQARKEIQAGYRPALKALPGDIGEYGQTFLGTPNWWSTIAPPIATFLESCELSGKTIVPFCTHGGGGFGYIERDIAKMCPRSTILPGLAVYGGSIQDAEVSAWLNQIGVPENK
jgi:flavodoxin